jgi:hypothetical protein
VQNEIKEEWSQEPDEPPHLHTSSTVVVLNLICREILKPGIVHTTYQTIGALSEQRDRKQFYKTSLFRIASVSAHKLHF